MHKILKQKAKIDKSYIVYDHYKDKYEVLDQFSNIVSNLLSQDLEIESETDLISDA